MTTFIRTPYNYDRDQASRDSGLCCTEPTRTQQQFAEEVDINTIVRRFGLTGMLPQGLKTPLQGDFTEVVDYQSALNLIKASDEAFMALPANVRSRFRNDAQEFLEFVSDEKNRPEAEQLGLVVTRSKPPETAAPAA